MSCPDWQALSQQGDADLDDAPAWRSAVEHFDTCSDCQAVAPTYLPTLLFRRLPALEVDHDGVAAMKQAVASMRRAQTIEHRRIPLARSWRHVAALAGVLLGSLLLRGASVGPEATTALDNVGPEARRNMSVPADVAPKVASEIDLWQMPLIEPIDPTYGSIIQVVDDDISVVLVMPSEVDV